MGVRSCSPTSLSLSMHVNAQCDRFATAVHTVLHANTRAVDASSSLEASHQLYDTPVEIRETLLPHLVLRFAQSGDVDRLQAIYDDPDNREILFVDSTETNSNHMLQCQTQCQAVAQALTLESGVTNPLHVAAKYNQVKVLQFFVEDLACLDNQAAGGAATGGLVSAGGDLVLTDLESSDHNNLNQFKSETTEITTHINLNCLDPHGWTPLRHAIENGAVDAIDYLVRSKASIIVVSGNANDNVNDESTDLSEIASLLCRTIKSVKKALDQDQISEISSPQQQDFRIEGPIRLLKSYLRADPRLAEATDHSGMTPRKFAEQLQEETTLALMRSVERTRPMK